MSFLSLDRVVRAGHDLARGPTGPCSVAASQTMTTNRVDLADIKGLTASPTMTSDDAEALNTYMCTRMFQLEFGAGIDEGAWSCSPHGSGGGEVGG